MSIANVGVPVLLGAVSGVACVLAGAWVMGNDRRPGLLAAFLLDAGVGLGGVATALLLLLPASGLPGEMMPLDRNEAGLVWLAAALAGSASALACWLTAEARRERRTNEAALARVLSLANMYTALAALIGATLLVAAAPT